MKNFVTALFFIIAILLSFSYILFFTDFAPMSYSAENVGAYVTEDGGESPDDSIEKITAEYDEYYYILSWFECMFYIIPAVYVIMLGTSVFLEKNIKHMGLVGWLSVICIFYNALLVTRNIIMLFIGLLIVIWETVNLFDEIWWDRRRYKMSELFAEFWTAFRSKRKFIIFLLLVIAANMIWIYAPKKKLYVFADSYSLTQKYNYGHMVNTVAGVTIGHISYQDEGWIATAQSNGEAVIEAYGKKFDNKYDESGTKLVYHTKVYVDKSLRFWTIPDFNYIINIYKFNVFWIAVCVYVLIKIGVIEITDWRSKKRRTGEKNESCG